MRYKGKAQEVANDILDAFRKGCVPEALAQVFIHRDIDSPCQAWSLQNRMLVALHGHVDARGYRQWQQVDRQVKKGERACHILAPWMAKAREDDEEKGIQAGDPVLIGFLAVPVFGSGQTEGPPLAWEAEEAKFLDALPLVEVARAWGIELLTFEAGPGGRAGFFARPATEGQGSQVIGLGTENLSTWAHELVHAADCRRGTLNPARGQQLDNEVVASFGGTVLLECLNCTVESDRGFAWRYIESYAEEHDREPLSVCLELFERTCASVELILDAADRLAAHPVALAS